MWADGGYYSRIFLNVRGREPQGVIAPEDYEAMRAELIAKLEALGDEQGASIGTRVYRPEDLYHEVNGVAPDLIAYFGNLTWRSIGSVGDGRIHVRENDTGPDDANHAKMGIAIMTGPGHAGGASGRRVAVRHRSHGADRVRPAGAGRHAGPQPQLTTARRAGPG